MRIQSIDIDVICARTPDAAVGVDLASLLLHRTIGHYQPLELVGDKHVSSVTGDQISLTYFEAVVHEFPGKSVVNVRSERREPPSYLACLLVAAAVGLCFDGYLGFDNWSFTSITSPDLVLLAALRHEDPEAEWLMARLAEVP